MFRGSSFELSASWSKVRNTSFSKEYLENNIRQYVKNISMYKYMDSQLLVTAGPLQWGLGGGLDSLLLDTCDSFHSLALNTHSNPVFPLPSLCSPKKLKFTFQDRLPLGVVVGGHVTEFWPMRRRKKIFRFCPLSFGLSASFGLEHHTVLGG